MAAEVAAGSIEGLEARASANPDDVPTLQALGEAYFRAGKFGQAATTYSKATHIDPHQAVLWSALGEAEVMASKSDPLPAQALANFEKALQLDPKDPRARYFVAVHKDLAGDHEGAITAWLSLLADTPPGAPWEADLKRTIEQVGKINGIAVESRIAAVKQPAPENGPMTALGGIPGPSADDIRNAAAIPPSQQHAMALEMVSRLANHLKDDPGDIDGWVMLMRSRMTLGQQALAAAALREAVAANPAEASHLRQQARLLGIS